MLNIRRFEARDAAAVSQLIRTTMRVTNSRDYSMAQLQPLMDYHSPKKMLVLAAERDCLVAEEDGRIVGTAALEDAQLLTFFVAPDHQQQGIGAQLLAAIERIAHEQGIASLRVQSSITGEPFYMRKGFVKTGRVTDGDAGRLIEMVKELPAAGGEP